MPISYKKICNILKDFEYQKLHQKGSHERRYYKNKFGTTLPKHKELTPKTAKSILQDIAEQHKTNYREIIKKYGLKL